MCHILWVIFNYAMLIVNVPHTMGISNYAMLIVNVPHTMGISNYAIMHQQCFAHSECMHQLKLDRGYFQLFNDYN